MCSTFALPVPAWLVRVCVVLVLSCLALPAGAQSLRFFGTGDNDVDRVKIARGGGQPADIGATDFTIEVWLRPSASGNGAGAITPAAGRNGAGYLWITGNTFFDGDVFNRNPGFGASLTAGRVTFGVKNASGDEETWRAITDIRNDRWHHVVITRSVSSGAVQIYVDGTREVDPDNGPTGDLSYPGGVPLSLCGRGGNLSCSFSDPFLVLAAEKHDAGTAYPSYSGYLTELRLSSSVRHSGPSIPVPTQPFDTDPDTLALYHFNEQAGADLFDTSSAAGGPSNGTVRFNAGATRPAWASDSPFAPTSPGSLQWVSSSASASEGAGSIVLSVTRIGGSSGAVSVNYATANGSASAGSDFTGTTGTLNWADGDPAVKTLLVPLLDDGTFEPAETFTVVLSAAAGGASVGTPATVTVTVNDNDPLPAAGSLQFSAATATVAEGAGSIVLTVTRTGGSSGPVSVNYATANGSASAGSDFTGTTGTLNWTNGDTAVRTVVVPILDDAVQESTEAFTVTLVNPATGMLGSPASVTVTIADNDATPVAGGGSGSSGGGGSLDIASLVFLWLAILACRRCLAACGDCGLQWSCSVTWLRAMRGGWCLSSKDERPCTLDPPGNSHRRTLPVACDPFT